MVCFVSACAFSLNLLIATSCDLPGNGGQRCWFHARDGIRGCDDLSALTYDTDIPLAGDHESSVGAGRMVMQDNRSSLRLQAADALRRARQLPVGMERNDLRQVGTWLLWLHRHGTEATVGERQTIRQDNDKL
jgi:hypothetical protein